MGALFLPKQSGGSCLCAEATTLAWMGYQTFLGGMGAGHAPPHPPQGPVWVLALRKPSVKMQDHMNLRCSHHWSKSWEPCHHSSLPAPQHAGPGAKGVAVGHGNHPAAGIGHSFTMGTRCRGGGGWHEPECPPGQWPGWLPHGTEATLVLSPWVAG